MREDDGLTVVEHLTSADNEASHGDLAKAGWKGDGWYYWERSWVTCHGPYENEILCKAAFRNYAAGVESGEKQACEPRS